MSIGSGLRFRVLRRDGFRCIYCGADGDESTLHVDHVLPVSRGGRDNEGNLVTSCADCNLGKSDALLDATEHQALARAVAGRAVRRRAMGLWQDMDCAELELRTDHLSADAAAAVLSLCVRRLAESACNFLDEGRPLAIDIAAALVSAAGLLARGELGKRVFATREAALEEGCHLDHLATKLLGAQEAQDGDYERGVLVGARMANRDGPHRALTEAVDRYRAAVSNAPNDDASEAAE